MDSELKQLAKKNFRRYMDEARELNIKTYKEVMAEDAQYPGRAQGEDNET